MKIVIDMNLPPSWAGVLEAGGHQTVHWSGVGSPKASDRDILLYARQRAYVVFPHDLDFGAISSPPAAGLAQHL
jgi:predicted nuclease of predicted toxin-antitoxin system